MILMKMKLKSLSKITKEIKMKNIRNVFLITFLTLNTFGQSAQQCAQGQWGIWSSMELDSRNQFCTNRPTLQNKNDKTTIETELERINLEKDINMNLKDIHKKNLLESMDVESNWAYYSLPYTIAGAAYREKYTGLDNWKKRKKYFDKASPVKMIKKKRIAQLSALEKYELLIANKDINNNDFILTNREWSTGQSYIDRMLSIPEWAGACHGTAPAVLSEKEPGKNIVIENEHGLEIPFSRQDIKILLSYAWANNPAPYKIFGSRCNLAMNDPLYSRLSSCRDINPALLHLMLVNVNGINNRSMIIDTSPGLQVWNRPVISYKFEYYNEKTNRTTKNIKLALSKSNDQRYKYSIGVWMRLKLLAETSLEADDLHKKRFAEVQLKYSLYIDKNFKILDGNWSSRIHPDFAWIPSLNKKPVTNSDRTYRQDHYHPPTPDLPNTIPYSLLSTAREAQADKLVSYYLIDYLNYLSRQE